MIEDAYHEAIQEAAVRGVSLLNAHKEAVTAAGMLLSALTGIEDDSAKSAVVALNLRPLKGTE
ncbi:MAG: hypothetical protein WCO00_12845 [Rhodospirillaceae bacterium]